MHGILGAGERCGGVSLEGRVRSASSILMARFRYVRAVGKAGFVPLHWPLEAVGERGSGTP